LPVEQLVLPRDRPGLTGRSPEGSSALSVFVVRSALNSAPGTWPFVRKRLAFTLNSALLNYDPISNKYSNVEWAVYER
jgi:hypothetical protein